MLSRRSLLWTAAALTVPVEIRPAAAELPLPTDKPILAITGRISIKNKDDAAVFDRPMLENLGMYTLETSTPWYNGRVRFEGIRMQRLMQAVGADGDKVIAYALNDYSTEIPISDFTQYEVLLALKRDGQYMSVRDKGPLFIVYPYDSRPELKHQKYYSRSAWQVARMVVK